jgi:hypothetical protein
MDQSQVTRQYVMDKQHKNPKKMKTVELNRAHQTTTTTHHCTKVGSPLQQLQARLFSIADGRNV